MVAKGDVLIVAEQTGGCPTRTSLELATSFPI